MKLLLIRLVLVIWIMGILSITFAQNPSPQSDFILSEVFYDAVGSDAQLEWVELYNRGNSSIDLSNYSLGNGGTDYTYSTVQLSGTVAPYSFFVVGGPTSNATNYNPIFDQAVDFSPNFQNSGSTADGVALFNVPASSITSSTVPIDVVIYGGSNSNNLINTTGNPGSVDVGDAPSGSSIERTSVNPNSWHIQNNPNPNSSPYQSTIPVELTNFTTTVDNNGFVILSWTTRTETENLGFYIYRSSAEDGKYAKITQELIYGTGSSNEAHSYSYIDHNVQPGNTYYYKLADVDFNGNMTFYEPISVTVDVMPKKYILIQNYPNPFNPETTINFILKESGKVTLNIYNLQGQLVRTLVDEDKPAGKHSVLWNGCDDTRQKVTSGIYFYRLEVNGFNEVKKFVLSK